MQINRACKYVLVAMLPVMAFAATAHADGSYQPYYYTRDQMQFARPSVPPQAPVAIVAPAQQQRPAMQFSDVPTVVPISVQPSSTPTVFTSDPVRAPVQFSNRPVATQPGEAVPVVMHPVVEESDEGPAMDMSAGLGW